ncbi:MAG: hypothetical protein ACRC4M_02630 [Mycoplasma sp.]
MKDNLQIIKANYVINNVLDSKFEKELIAIFNSFAKAVEWNVWTSEILKNNENQIIIKGSDKSNFLEPMIKSLCEKYNTKYSKQVTFEVNVDYLLDEEIKILNQKLKEYNRKTIISKENNLIENIDEDFLTFLEDASFLKILKNYKDEKFAIITSNGLVFTNNIKQTIFENFCSTNSDLEHVFKYLDPSKIHADFDFNKVFDLNSVKDLNRLKTIIFPKKQTTKTNNQTL